MRFEELGPVRADQEAEATLRAAEVLAGGGLLVHPTSTVYGIGGEDPETTDREILSLKGSGGGRPLLRLVFDADAVRRLFPKARWTETADRLARSFWPGPLTLVLDDGTPGGIAVRAESHPLTRAVLRIRDRSLSSTSLNRTGEAPAVDEEEARRLLQAFPRSFLPVAFLNGGRLAGPPPSTVLSLRTDPPSVVREGAIPLARIRECLSERVRS